MQEYLGSDQFTYTYAQPKEYRFSLDSIHLAEYVASQLKASAPQQGLRVLDLCAGCGVVGMELAWYAQELRNITFVEVQTIYTEYFQQNKLTISRPELELTWCNQNYDDLLEKAWKNKFDLIVSNPPYFNVGQGVLSPSTFKNRCRFYVDSTFEKFILSLCNTLAPGGKAYFLLRCLKQHGQDVIAQVKSLLPPSMILTCDVRIRGTYVIKLEKDI